ncbi:MAG: restriction endonuclease subunit S [Solirubrobacterales bacterium]
MPAGTPPEKPLRYMDISSVGGDGSLREPQTMLFADAPSRARRLGRPGDTAVSTVRTYLKAIAFVDEEHSDCVWSTGFAILSPGQELDPKFLYYVTRSTQFVSEIERRSVGISYPAVNAEDLTDILCPVPPLEEQRRIADFLDREVSRLEALERSHHKAAMLARERTEETILRRVIPASAEWAPGCSLNDLSLLTSIEGWKPIRLKFTVEGAVNGVWGDEATGGPEDTRCVRVADFDYSRGRVESAPTLRAVPGQIRQQKGLRTGDLLLEKQEGAISSRSAVSFSGITPSTTRSSAPTSSPGCAPERASTAVTCNYCIALCTSSG